MYNLSSYNSNVNLINILDTNKMYVYFTHKVKYSLYNDKTFKECLQDYLISLGIANTIAEDITYSDSGEQYVCFNAKMLTDYVKYTLINA